MLIIEENGVQTELKEFNRFLWWFEKYVWYKNLLQKQENLLLFMNKLSTGYQQGYEHAL